MKTLQSDKAHLNVRVLAQNIFIDSNRTCSITQHQYQLDKTVARRSENPLICNNESSPGVGLVLTGSLIIIAMLRHFR